MNIFKKNKNKDKGYRVIGYKGKNAQKSTTLQPSYPTTLSSGFTLVETLVAIAILMIAIAGPLTVAEKGLSASIYARNQLMASYLAQDGMEAIKNLADTNEIAIHQNSSNISWLNYGAYPDLSKVCTSSTPCIVDTINNTISPCSSSCALYLTLGGYVQNGTGQASNFTRTFYIQGFNTDGSSCISSTCNAANVVMNVTWPGDVTGGGGVKLEDTMYDTTLQ